MKSKRQLGCMTVAIAGMWMVTACGSSRDYKEYGKEEAKAPVHAHSEGVEHADTTAQDSTHKAAFSVAGVIGEVTPGKDGFMATITSEKGVVYSSVFSIRSLEKHYKQLKAGDKVEVFGDTMQLGDKTHIMVKQFTQQ